MLIFVIVSFVCAGALCTRRLANAPSPAARYLRLQIISTVLCVFVTFLLRTIFAVCFAVGNAARSSCSEACGSCQSGSYLLGRYLSNTPELRYAVVAFTLICSSLTEFRYAVEIISSPVSLLIMLWGMTSRRALEALLPWLTEIPRPDSTHLSMTTPNVLGKRNLIVQP